MAQNFKTNPRPLSLLAGLCFVILVVAGPVGLMIVPEQIFAPGNPQLTMENVSNKIGLLHIGITAQVIIVLTEIILTAALYVLIKPASKPLAMMAAFARLTMTAIMAVNLLPFMEMAHLAFNPLAGFTPEQTAAMIDLAYQKHLMGTIAWQLTFSLHLLLLGLTVLRTTYLPAFIGYALILGSPSYLLDSYGRLLALNELGLYSTATNIFLGVAAIGELGLGLWLLFKGVNLEKWREKLAS